MKLTRDAFKSDVLELNQEDLEILGKGGVLSCLGLQIQKEDSVVDRIAKAIAAKTITRDGLSKLILPIKDYMELNFHISTSSTIATQKLTCDGATWFMGLRVYRYNGDKIVVD